ncbi:MAG: quinolinate synthase NadA [Candidatus Xenobiia bacterium LiM19]
MDTYVHDPFITLKEKVLALKEKREAVILAHMYQRPEIQDIADYVEDSLGLARAARATSAKVIVLCGVHFMAETAAMMNPDKMVLLPDSRAGCPMADMITAESLRAAKAAHPGVKVMCYVNTSAEVKAESDICCTSSNAAALVKKLPDHELIFVPDQSLGAYVASKTDKTIHLWPGYCNTHHRLLEEDVLAMKEKYPDSFVMAHPECTEGVLRHSDFIGSTSQMIQYARTSPCTNFLVGTESGILHRLTKDSPGKTFRLISEKLVCPNMKLTTLEKVLWALEDLKTHITVPEEITRRALGCLEKMMELS